MLSRSYISLILFVLFLFPLWTASNILWENECNKYKVMRTVYKSSIDFKRCSTALLGQYLHKQKEKKIGRGHSQKISKQKMAFNKYFLTWTKNWSLPIFLDSYYKVSISNSSFWLKHSIWSQSYYCPDLILHSSPTTFKVNVHTKQVL